MLFHVLNYNYLTGIAKVVEAGLTNFDYDSNGEVTNVTCGANRVSPSSFQLSMYINPRKWRNEFQVDCPYSFNLKDRLVDGNFVRGELDYKNPFPMGTEC